MSTNTSIEEAQVVSENGKKKMPFWLKIILGCAFGACLACCFIWFWDEIKFWIVNDPYFSRSISFVFVGILLIALFWDSAHKPKRHSTTMKPILSAEEFDPISFGACMVYLGSLLVMTAVILISWSFIKGSWLYILAIILIVVFYFILDENKKLLWGIALILLLGAFWVDQPAMVRTVFSKIAFWNHSKNKPDNSRTTHQNDTTATTPKQDTVQQIQQLSQSQSSIALSATDMKSVIDAVNKKTDSIISAIKLHDKKITDSLSKLSLYIKERRSTKNRKYAKEFVRNRVALEQNALRHTNYLIQRQRENQ